MIIYSRKMRAREVLRNTTYFFSRIQVCFISDDLAFEIGIVGICSPPPLPSPPLGVMMSDLSEI